MLLYIFLLVLNPWSTTAAPLNATTKCLNFSNLLSPKFNEQCQNVELLKTLLKPTEENTKNIRCTLLHDTYTLLCDKGDDFLTPIINSKTLETAMNTSDVCKNIADYLQNAPLSSYFRNVNLCTKICLDFSGDLYETCKYIGLLSYNIVHNANQNPVIVQPPVAQKPPSTPGNMVIPPAPKVDSNETQQIDHRVLQKSEQPTVTQQAPKAIDSSTENELLTKQVKTSTSPTTTTTTAKAATSSEKPVVKMTAASVVIPEKISSEQISDKSDDKVEADLDLQEYPDVGEKLIENKPENMKPMETKEESVFPYANESAINEDDSYFFFYFMFACVVFVLGYVGYHNKQKILALVLEGRKGRRTQRRRPNSANYHKLDCNLEEAVTSTCSNKSTTNVIY